MSRFVLDSNLSKEIYARAEELSLSLRVDSDKIRDALGKVVPVTRMTREAFDAALKKGSDQVCTAVAEANQKMRSISNGIFNKAKALVSGTDLHEKIMFDVLADRIRLFLFLNKDADELTAFKTVIDEYESLQNSRAADSFAGEFREESDGASHSVRTMDPTIVGGASRRNPNRGKTSGG